MLNQPTFLLAAESVNEIAGLNVQIAAAEEQAVVVRIWIPT